MPKVAVTEVPPTKGSFSRILSPIFGYLFSCQFTIA
jgi:hypothetical protein